MMSWELLRLPRKTLVSEEDGAFLPLWRGCGECWSRVGRRVICDGHWKILDMVSAR